MSKIVGEHDMDQLQTDSIERNAYQWVKIPGAHDKDTHLLSCGKDQS